MTEVEIVARALAPNAWAADTTNARGLTFEEVLRQQSIVLAERAITALDSHRASLGLVTVPEEPTGEILDAIESASMFEDIQPGVRRVIGYDSPENLYRAMIRALTTAKKREARRYTSHTKGPGL